MRVTHRSSSSQRGSTILRCHFCSGASSESLSSPIQEDDAVQFSELKDKACLVTGASRGIGAAVARGLGRCGARVAVHYRSGRNEAEGVAADIEAAGGKAVLVEGDIAQRGVAE